MADNIFKRKLYCSNGVSYILVDNGRIGVSDIDIRRGFVTQYDKVYVFSNLKKVNLYIMGKDLYFRSDNGCEIGFGLDTLKSEMNRGYCWYGNSYMKKYVIVFENFDTIVPQYLSLFS